MRRPVGLCAVVAMVLSGCASAAVAPIGTSGSVFTPDADERLLWTQADREATTLRGRVQLYEDPALAAYLAALADRLTPDPVKAAGGPPVRVAVIRDPTLAAFALPDGRVFLHAGLLAAVASEPQLALVLARELAHVFRRHALGAQRAGEIAPVRVEATAPLSPTGGAIVAAGLPLVFMASTTGYRSRFEREADEDALSSIAGAGWDTAEAAAVWPRLAEELSGRGGLETFLLGRATWLQARRQARQRPPTPRPASAPMSGEAFETVRRAVLRDNAADDVRRARFALARRQLDRLLAAAPGDAPAHVVYGDLFRLQSQRAVSAEEREAEIQQARARYTSALALDPTLASAHRQLGLLYYQQQDFARARAELESYLAGAAGAPDAARIAEYVRELAR